MPSEATHEVAPIRGNTLGRQRGPGHWVANEPGSWEDMAGIARSNLSPGGRSWPRSEPDSGNPTVRDRRAALRNVTRPACGGLVRALNFEPDNRMHSLTGGSWKRNNDRPGPRR